MINEINGFCKCLRRLVYIFKTILQYAFSFKLTLFYLGLKEEGYYIIYKVNQVNRKAMIRN